MIFTRKNFIVILGFFIFLLNADRKVQAFDPIQFDLAAKAKFGEKFPEEVKIADAKTKLAEVQTKILSGEIPLEEGNQDDLKIVTFLKDMQKTSDWQKSYPKMNQLVVSLLIKYYIRTNSDATRIVAELPTICGQMKDNVLALVGQDPKFSKTFKEALRTKFAQIGIYAYGITTPLSQKSPVFSLDKVYKIGEHLEGVDDFEQNPENNSCQIWIKLIGQPSCNPFYSLLQINGTMYADQDLLTIYPGALFMNLLLGGSFDEQVASLVGTLGHELSHVINSYFKSYYCDYILGLLAYNEALPTLLYNYLQKNTLTSSTAKIKDELTTLKEREFREMKAHPKENELFKHSPTCEAIDSQVWELIKKNVPREDIDILQERFYEARFDMDRSITPESKILLTVPTKSDIAHFGEIYQFFVHNFEDCNRKLDLKGIDPEKINGRIVFREMFADVYGQKAALLLAAKRMIPEETVWQAYANDVWEPQNVEFLTYATHSISPFRINGCYQLVESYRS